MVGTAAAMGMTVAVFFFTEGALLARRGVYSNINENLRTMFNSARKKKVKFYVCAQAARKRGLEETDVEEGFTVIGYSTFLDLATSAGTVITV